MAILLDILAAGVTDATGSPLSQGKVYVYQPGTTSKQNCYTDADLTVQSQNPLTLDDAGRAEIYVNDPVRLVIEDEDGVPIDDIENVGGVSSLDGDLTIGTNSSNFLKINSRIQTDLDPWQPDTYSLGDATNTWKTAYFAEMPCAFGVPIGFPAGTKMVFYQAAAPTGWTRDTTAALNDKFIRIVTADSPGTTGGQHAASTNIGAHTHTLSSAGWALIGFRASDYAYIQAKQKTVSSYNTTHQENVTGVTASNPMTQATELGGATDLTSVGTGSYAYADMMIATKDAS